MNVQTKLSVIDVPGLREHRHTAGLVTVPRESTMGTCQRRTAVPIFVVLARPMNAPKISPTQLSNPLAEKTNSQIRWADPCHRDVHHGDAFADP